MLCLPRSDRGPVSQAQVSSTADIWRGVSTQVTPSQTLVDPTQVSDSNPYSGVELRP